MKEFIEKILQTLTSNGFPEKRVSLPTDKMFELADSKGFSFNDVLQNLKVEHDIEAKIGAEKIIFSQAIAEKPAMNQEDMMKQAQEWMSEMDDSVLNNMKDMFQKMTPAQLEEYIKRLKDIES